MLASHKFAWANAATCGACLIFLISTWLYFQSWSTHVIFSKRRPILLRFFLIWLIGTTAIERSASILYGYQLVVSRGFTIGRSAMVLLLLMNVAYFTFFILYIQFFDLHHGAALRHQAWMCYLNPSAGESNWFVRNKATWGNPRWVGKRVIAYSISVSFISLVAILLNRPWGISIGTLGAMPAIVGFAVMACNTCNLPNDYWDISTQLNVALGVSVFGYIGGAIVPVITRATGALPAYVIVFINQQFTFLHFGGICFALYLYPIIHFRHKWEEYEKKMMGSGDEMQKKKTKTFGEIMRSKRQFELFMDHLVRELCPEVMLFLLEVTQMKEYFRTKSGRDFVRNDVKNAHDPKVFCELANIPMELPRSSLIPDDDVEWSCEAAFRVAHGIFAKYVSLDASLEVNVSSFTRQDLYQYFEGRNPPVWTRFDFFDTSNAAGQGDQAKVMIQMENMHTESKQDIEKMFHIFDEATIEMGNLLAQAIVRFDDLESSKDTSVLSNPLTPVTGSPGLGPMQF